MEEGREGRGVGKGRGVGGTYLHIIVWHILEARDKRSEVSLIFGLPRGGDGGEGAAVEGLQRGDDHRMLAPQHRVRVLARQLDRRLVRLGARVAEEGFVMTACAHQLGSELPLNEEVKCQGSRSK